ncbi:MAG TPA: T9SS type A sorting domain-containing protein [Flavobacterium sp.]|uniref:T9SS type A sorting domain-containing protein n=1 Tax=Flavobacterium sp. TaxID=239 RepID=UPI002CC7A6D1|nr:T9SS type A sorting domain-containing protein [Flavobacterium sp.]HNP32209.1 T9SS type A sorting domain-containing protein [Flavobacterium sp.]
MKRPMLVFCVLFIINTTLAQIYVKNNSYIFNKGTVVYSKGNLELNGTNSNFYLRNEGQFLQGTTGSSTNTGEGKLSVFQEGTSNNYAYNYWCSPVGKATNGVTTNEDFGISLLNVPTTNVLSNAATIDNTSYNGVSGTGTLSIASYWIFTYVTQSAYSGWVHNSGATTINPGLGFTMKGTSGSDATTVGETASNNPGSAQRYDFRGKPNDGNISVSVANGQWTLIGNPYPSAIDLSAFLTAETNCTGVAYFWEHDKTVNSHVLINYRGGYGTYSPVSRGGTGIYVPAKFYSYDINGILLPLTVSSPNHSFARYFSPVGQGFMVEGNGAGSTVTMKNSYRVFQKENVSTSVFEKNSNTENSTDGNYLPQVMSVSGFDYTTVSNSDVPQIRFNTLLNNEAIKQIVLAFDNEATDGPDHAKDAKNPDAAPLDVNFVLNNEDYIISVIQFDENKRLPVSFKATNNATFKITVADMLNFNQADNVYLYDKETGIYHDIKNAEYEFVLPIEGTYSNRFEITFKNQALSVSNLIKDNIFILQNNTDQQLTISNPNLLDVKEVRLFDMLGKQIFRKVNLGSKTSYEFTTASLSEGVYLVKIESADGQNIGQKIIISSPKN